MAAPTPVVRLTPVGIYLKDGYRALLTLTADPDISLWEIGVTPPGMDGGDPIDGTTMHNTTYRTLFPRALRTMTDSSTRFAYDPQILTQLENVVNVRSTVTIRFKDGSTWALYAFLRSAEFDELIEGTLPVGTATFTATNFDPTNNVEAGPALASVAGT